MRQPRLLGAVRLWQRARPRSPRARPRQLTDRHRSGRPGRRIEDLTGPVITEAAQQGDALAIELIAEIGQWLGTGIANLAAALDPGLFVIGGGVSAAGELLLGPAREQFRRQLTGRGYRPEARIEQAALGNEAGLIGAADLSRADRLE